MQTQVLSQLLDLKIRGFFVWACMRIRGGLRVIYYWHVPGSLILLLLAYPKNEQENLTPAQLKVLKTIIETEFP